MTDSAEPRTPVSPLSNLTRTVGIKPLRLDPRLSDALVEIGSAVAQLRTSIAEAMSPLGRIFSEAFRDAERAKAVQEAGWLPHATMPIDGFDKDTPKAEIDALLTAHYRDHWRSVRETFSHSVQSSGVDDEAKATFEEALAAHEAGFYRSVVRLLFPEIERVARETVYGGSRREAPCARWPKGKSNTNLVDFRKGIKKLPAGMILDRTYALALIDKLHQHLYQWVPENEEGVSVFQRDPVPNRHCSQHGFVTYSSAQNSINMLVMADFLFQIIVEANAYWERAARQDDAG